MYAALFIPEGFVQDIMSGTNTPVTVVLADQSQMESRIFKELTQGEQKPWEQPRRVFTAG